MITVPVFAVLALGGGTAVWIVSGHGRWAILGLAAGAACTASLVYYRLTVSGIPQGWDRSWRLFVFPEVILRSVAFAAPTVAGGVTSATTGDWRWIVTGLVLATFLPGIGELAYYTLTLTGVIPAILFWGLVSVPIGLITWLWSSAVNAALSAAIPFGIGVFILAVMVWAIMSESNY